MSENYKTKYGNWKSRTNIIAALSSQTYIGRVPHRGTYYDGRHEAIIDQDTFDAAQKILALRSSERKPTDPHHSPFKATQLLTGLLWCGNCGARFYAVGAYRGSKKLPYRQRTLIHHYMCYSRAKTRAEMIRDPNCKNEKWSVEELNTYIANEILKLKYNHSEILQLTSSKAPKNVISEDSVTLKRIKIIEQQIGKLLDLYQIQNVPFEQISDRLQSLTQEKERLGATLDNDSDENGNALCYEAAVALLDESETILATGSLEDRRYHIQSLINRIILTEKKVEIDWNF